MDDKLSEILQDLIEKYGYSLTPKQIMEEVQSCYAAKLADKELREELDRMLISAHKKAGLLTPDQIIALFQSRILGI